METPESRRSWEDEVPNPPHTDEELGLAELAKQGWQQRSFYPAREYAMMTEKRSGIPVAHYDRLDPSGQMVVIGYAFRDAPEGEEPAKASFVGNDDLDRLRMAFIFNVDSKTPPKQWRPVGLVRVFAKEKVVSASDSQFHASPHIIECVAI